MTDTDDVIAWLENHGYVVLTSEEYERHKEGWRRKPTSNAENAEQIVENLAKLNDHLVSFAATIEKLILRWDHGGALLVEVRGR